MFQLNDTTHYVEKILDLLKKELHPTRNLACFEHYLKIVKTNLKRLWLSWGKLSEKVQK